MMASSSNIYRCLTALRFIPNRLIARTKTKQGQDQKNTAAPEKYKASNRKVEQTTKRSVRLNTVSGSPSSRRHCHWQIADDPRSCGVTLNKRWIRFEIASEHSTRKL